MAVVSPYVLPIGGLDSALSPFSGDQSPSEIYQAGFPTSGRVSNKADSLAPPPSPYPQQIDPSPTDSNGTENTDIDEEVQDEFENTDLQPRTSSVCSRPQSRDNLVKIDTAGVVRPRSDSDDAPSSVIHAPAGFKEFKLNRSSNVGTESATRSSSYDSHQAVASPTTPDAALGPDDKRLSMTAPLNTNVPPIRDFDRPTPQAQTRQEAEEEWKRRSRRTSSLEDIPEMIGLYGANFDDGADETHPVTGSGGEVEELRSALNELWTLCNTLSNLSSNNRQRMFNGLGKDSSQEVAWRSCWHLCQQLYESSTRSLPQTLPLLDLCRQFCQDLFDVRQRGDEAVDSVLRVSFEMNNHLYNTHDRNLPEAFRERTLDFYVTLCHRLMKQQTSLARDTDNLLRACWSLAEALFNLRQGERDSRRLDDLLASSVQACWNLCDVFRARWSYLRPDRSTPRQTAFPPSVSHYSSSASHSERAPSSLSSEYHDAPSLPPETPTTIFDDATTVSSPESIDVPNILVLGPTNLGGSTHRAKHHERWSSNASTLSDRSESAASQRTSSTARASNENRHLVRLRYMIIKAALNVGFSRTSGQSLSAFTQSLSATAFGSHTWQTKLLTHYKQLVQVDHSLRSAAGMPCCSLTAIEMAKAVNWLGSTAEFRWLLDLYRLVFDFGVEEAEVRGGLIQI